VPSLVSFPGMIFCWKLCLLASRDTTKVRAC